MLIDWFTVGAQALNFFILVWLMRRFLYAPVLAAIDAREARIARQLADADTQQTTTRAVGEDLLHKSELFDRQRAALLEKAGAEANAEKARLIEAAVTAADVLSTKRRQVLESEARLLDQSLGRLVRDEVFEVVRKALKDLASADLQACMVATFNRRLADMPEAARSALGGALRSASQPASLRSAFGLSAELQAAMQSTLNQTFDADIALRFETAPRLVSGIELVADGYKLSWNIADYVANLEKRVADLVGLPAPLPSSTSATQPATPSVVVAAMPTPAIA